MLFLCSSFVVIIWLSGLLVIVVEFVVALAGCHFPSVFTFVGSHCRPAAEVAPPFHTPVIAIARLSSSPAVRILFAVSVLISFCRHRCRCFCVSVIVAVGSGVSMKDANSPIGAIQLPDRPSRSSTLSACPSVSAPPSTHPAAIPANLEGIQQGGSTPASNGPNVIAHTLVSKPEVGKKFKRFNYLPAYDELLIRSVREHGAHKVQYGKKLEALEAVRTTFIQGIPPHVFQTYETPNVKSIRDRYLRLIERRKDAVKSRDGESGQLEEVSDMDALLDGLILEKEATAREERVNAAGAEFRDNTVSRKRKENVDDLDGERKAPVKQQRRATTSVLEEVSTCMADSVERQKQSEQRKTHLDERRFELELTRLKKEEERFQRTQEFAEKRHELDEKKFQLDKLEREERLKLEREESQSKREERKAVLELLKKLIER